MQGLLEMTTQGKIAISFLMTCSLFNEFIALVNLSAANCFFSPMFNLMSARDGIFQLKNIDLVMKMLIHQ